MRLRITFVCMFFIQSAIAHGQDIEAVPQRLAEPREAFFENAPLAEVGFAEPRFNAKQQRLREHYLPTPIGDVPQDLQNRELAVVPPESRVQSDGVAAVSVSIRQNRALNDSETSNATSTVGEPSLGVRGQEILVTGNWFASFSRDGGNTFSYRNPETVFPSIPNRPFCCDQLAFYVPSHDLMIWFLQHVKDATGNTVRLAVAHGADIAAERWRYYDFTPQGVGNWSQEWFDYPDIAASSQNLFITTNSFNMSNQFQRAVVLRIPLNELQTYSALNYHFFNRTDIGSLRLTQGAAGTMYIGGHANTSSLRVYSWPDAVTNIATKNFTVDAWNRGGAAAPGPDGRDWLGFVDGRITGAWASGDSQGFAWTSAPGGSFPKPNARLAIIDWNGGSVLSQPHIWNSQVAFAYPGCVASSAGALGIGLSYGGGGSFPSHAVGALDGNAWSLVATAVGTDGPNQNRWGDYQSIRLNGQNQNRFACMGFTLVGGPDRDNIVPRLVQFEVTTTPSLDPAPSPVLSSLAVRIPSDVASSEAKADEKLTGYKFSLELKKKNVAWKNSVVSLTEAVSSDDKPETTTKSIIALDGQSDLSRYQELLRLRDIGEYFFEPAESVCLPDDRIQILDTATSPWSGNCQLIIEFANGERARGTGWFLSPRLIVTAGHCVHAGAGEDYFKSIEVIPGMSGPSMPFGSIVCPKENLRASAAWISNGSVSDDYGAIILPSAFSNSSGTSPAVYSVSVLDDTQLQGLGIGLSGYPADKPTGTQWMDQGPISSFSAKRLNYTIDTFGGHSGSAVFTSDSNRAIIGIHNYGGCPNKCTRINSSVMSDLNQWLSETGP
jgi:V8-like Glu-specific endopeptidase